MKKKLFVGLNDRLKSIILVDHKYPEPDRDAGSVRMATIIQLFIELGLRVHFVTQNKPSTKWSVIHSAVSIYTTESEIHQNLSVEAGQPLAVWIARPELASTYLPVFRKMFPLTAIVYDTIDLHYLRLARQLKVERANLRRSERRRRQATIHFTHALEKLAIQTCDYAIFVTKEDRLHSPANKIRNQTFVLSHINQPTTRVHKGFDMSCDLIFLGGFAHAPNLDAIHHFTKEVFPEVLSKCPSIKLVIAGADAPASVKQLESLPGVKSVGFIKDIESSLCKSRLMIAPLRYGAGVKGKICLALSLGLPVVGSNVAFEGMPVKHGKEVVVANTPEEYAYQIQKLYESRSLWESISERAKKLAKNHYSVDSAEHTLSRIFDSIVTRRITISDTGMNQRDDLAKRFKKIESKYIRQNLLAPAMEKDTETFIWGTGSGARSLLTYLQSVSVKVSGLVERQSVLCTEEFSRLKVISFDSLRSYAEHISESVTLFIPSTFAKEIIAYVKSHTLPENIYIEEVDYMALRFLRERYL